MTDEQFESMMTRISTQTNQQFEKMLAAFTKALASALDRNVPMTMASQPSVYLPLPGERFAETEVSASSALVREPSQALKDFPLTKIPKESTEASKLMDMSAEQFGIRTIESHVVDYQQQQANALSNSLRSACSIMESQAEAIDAIKHRLTQMYNSHLQNYTGLMD